LIRRLLDNFRKQDWLAICLELVVVVVGIFLAFQVDRWYDQARLKSEEQEYLTALSEDFKATREAFSALRDRHEKVTNSAVRLLSYKIGDPIDLTHGEFYDLLADIQLIRTADSQRGSYNLLISSGKIDVIQDERLRQMMSELFARIDGTSSDITDDLQSYWRDSFEPYVKEHLDHVALMQSVHPRNNMSLEPTYALDQFHEVIGTGKFEAVISDKWHLSSDLVLNYEARIEDIQAIEAMIAEKLSSAPLGD
jgi:hypothetical protein